MKRIELYELVSGLFEFKTFTDENGNEFVLLSGCNAGNPRGIYDKTAFESTINHVHLMDNIKESEFERLISVAKSLGKAQLQSLNAYFPDKKFNVYVSLQIGDSMIIRFHQQWENEEPYCYPCEFESGNEIVFVFCS